MKAPGGVKFHAVATAESRLPGLHIRLKLVILPLPFLRGSWLDERSQGRHFHRRRKKALFAGATHRMTRMLRNSLPRLSVTTLSQHVKVNNCDCYLRFRLEPQRARRFTERWGITVQPAPLLQAGHCQPRTRYRPGWRTRERLHLAYGLIVERKTAFRRELAMAKQARCARGRN